METEPNIVGQKSVLQFTMLEQFESDTHKHVFYPNDCFVLWFDPIEALPDWKPVINDDICEFEEGKLHCRKLSDFAMLLHVGTNVVSGLQGTVGQIQNPPAAYDITINRIDFFEGCLGFKKNSKKKIKITDIEAGVPNDQTPMPITIVIAPDAIPEASFVPSENVLGIKNDVKVTFEATTEILVEEGHIELTSPTSLEGVSCTSTYFDTLEAVE